MRMKLKNLKKLISVAIICTMIVALFVPTLSVQAAETQSLMNVVENYTDIENSEYKITDVVREYSQINVYYSVPENCRMIMAEYDDVTGFLKNIEDKRVSSTDSRTYFYMQSSSNQSTTIKLFIVDYYNRPLGKSYTEDIKITVESEAPSFGYGYDMEPHPTVPLKNDSGKYAYGANWSVNTNGLLTVDVVDSYLFTTGEHTAPWDEYREEITSVSIPESPDNITDVGSYMFQGLSKVKEVTIPSQANLFYKTFVDMPSLEKVILTYNPTGYYNTSPSYVGGESFINCPSLKEFIVDENDSKYMTIDGVLYSKSGKILIKYPAGKTDKTFTVPDGVVDIDSYAFEGATNLESIYNVPSVSYNHAFENCTSLKNIEFSSNCKEFNLSSFANCTSLKNLNLPDSLKNIYTCNYYYHMENNREDCNHFDTTALESVNIPACVSNMYYIPYFTSALPGSLKNIDVKEDDSSFMLVDGALLSKDMTTLYRYLGGSENTSYNVPESVTCIEDSAFKNCKNLKNIEIGSNVESIGSNAFEGCVNLTDINLSDVSVIYSEAFKNCINLKNVELGSVTEINSKAFDGCKSLESITIPASVNYIYSGIFANCDSLRTINVAEGNTKYSSVDGCLYQGKTLMEYPNAKAENYVVSSDTTEINTSAFQGRNSLKSVVIPESVDRVFEYAFADCVNLTSVSLPEGFDNIDSYTFYNCTSLSQINFPDSLSQICYFAFGNCKSLKSIEFPETIQSDMMYLCSRSFYNCGLESVTIPGYVYLDYVPFFSCYNLKSVKFELNFFCNYLWMSAVFWNFDDLTIYYPEGNKNWDSTIIHNYQHKDSLKFVSYNDSNKNYDSSYTFTGLVPNSTYIVGINDGAVDYNLLDSYSLLYFDQLNSDSNGNITVNFKTDNQTGKIVPFALGEAEYNISNASIDVADIVYSGREQDKPDNYKVIFDGKELTEGVDYLVVDGSGFDGSGIYSFSVVGIGNYYGEASQSYTVLGTEYDVDDDGMITIRDVTAIQFYLAGIRDLNHYYMADADGDGDVTINDVTYIQKLLAGIC
ncbi:leucine-rich repeat protein [Ruminococcus sp.]|uniref:leucine-rich repeat protein n=1 Tax=Ruminococcus sp. TaxID=41978 RepID=UPI003F01850B